MNARLLGAFLFVVVTSCGGAKPPPAIVAPAGPDLDSDPLALLPGEPVVVANVDAKALFSNAAVGGQMEALATRYVPLGPDAGFDARRDVERVAVATYDAKGNDAAAVLSGHFDVAKISAATKAKNGAPIVHGNYQGTDTWESGHGVWTVLSPKTIIAGTSLGVRQVLDKIHAHNLTRAEPAWMLPVLETAGAAFASAGDFEKAPLKAMSVGPVQLSWMEGIRTSHAVGHLRSPGMSIAATLTYGDGGKAQSAADAMRGETSWLKLLGPLLGGISLQSFDAKASGNDVQCNVSVDDDSLAKIVALGSKQLPGGS